MFMMGMLLIEENRKRWVYFATLTMITSVLGAVVGYLLAFFLFDTIGREFITLFGYQQAFGEVKILLDKGVFVFMMIGSISPIPYKIFVLTSGFVKANFWVFLIASLLGRSIRLYLSAWVVYKYGDHGIKVSKRYGKHISIISVVLIIVYILGYMYL
jgi:membrane protein YqaA with SNARE-associated domain